jgi:hypothetical protein
MKKILVSLFGIFCFASTSCGVTPQPHALGVVKATSLVAGTAYYTYGSSGTITPAASQGNNIAITLTSSATINVPTGAFDFQTFRYSVTQGGVGNYPVTLGTGFNFGVDVTTVTFSTTTAKTDYFMCLYRTGSGKCDMVSGSVRGY